MLAVVISLAVTGRYERLREHLSVYTVCLTACVACSVALPAIGAYAHLGLADLAAERLPQGSGIYHLPTLERLKSVDALISPFTVEGVVTFPSFHACMALMIWYPVRDVAVLRWAGALAAAVTLVATVPIGGHYVIDLAAGAVVFTGAAALAGQGRSSAARAVFSRSTVLASPMNPSSARSIS
jgi:membrane-associated phospholipid phosphatase